MGTELDLGRIIEANIASDMQESARSNGRYLAWLDRVYTADTVAAQNQSPETLGALNSFSHVPMPQPFGNPNNPWYAPAKPA